MTVVRGLPYGVGAIKEGFHGRRVGLEARNVGGMWCCGMMKVIATRHRVHDGVVDRRRHIRFTFQDGSCGTLNTPTVVLPTPLIHRRVALKMRTNVAPPSLTYQNN
jgi:hypothetical protein